MYFPTAKPEFTDARHQSVLTPDFSIEMPYGEGCLTFLYFPLK